MMRAASADLPEVSIAIVSCNGRALLGECLESLRELDYPAERIETIVYDNGSSDGTARWLAAEWPRVRVLAGETNLGFAAPNNRVAGQAAAPLLCLVNNDMRFAPDFLRELVVARAASGAACVGARILSADGRRIDFDGGTMNFYGHGAPLRHGVALPPDEAVGAALVPEETLFACGGAMLVDRDVFLAAGGFDESYFAYFEDVDLGWRLWLLGERCVQAPAACAYHREHGSERLLAPEGRLTLLERNALLTIYKNYEERRAERVWRCALALLAERARLEPARAQACTRGLLEALAALPEAEGKRRALAARRVRRDRDVVPLFRDPWRPPIAGAAYRERQVELATLFGADDLLPAAPRCRAPAETGEGAPCA